MGIFSAIGKGLKKVAKIALPAAALIPGVGTAVAGAAGLAGKALAGGGGTDAAGGGAKKSSIWDTLGKIGGVVGGGVKAYNDSKNSAADRRSTEAGDALAEKRFGLDEGRFGEDKRQWDEGFGLKRDQFGEDTRQFNEGMGLKRDQFGLDEKIGLGKLNLDRDQFGLDSEISRGKLGLDREKFGKENETEQFGRARNTRFAKVRSPLIGGLMRGQQLKNIPGVPGGI